MADASDACDKNCNEKESMNNAGTTGKKRKLTKEDRKRNAKEKKLKLTERKKPPGFDRELYDETTYFTKNGLRHVRPYYFTYTTHCKGRWLKRELLDIFREEFRSESVDYYEKAINTGKITVNGEKATTLTVLKDNDVIRNLVHRHEPPVTDKALEFVENNDDVVVLNKPSSIPVHPCGRYRHNTVVFLLGKEHNLRNLYTIHRIDRLTSGILIFARSLKKARQLEAQVRERQVQKEYVCRVVGEFPSEPVDCEQPISVVSHKVGVCRVSPDGKLCRTVFTKLHSNGTSSVVKCIPYTGRMHQIRVHLQWLGYPIINDPIYNHAAWGPDRGRGEVSDDLAIEVMKAVAESSTIIGSVDSPPSAIPSAHPHSSTSTESCLVRQEPAAKTDSNIQGLLSKSKEESPVEIQSNDKLHNESSTCLLTSDLDVLNAACERNMTDDNHGNAREQASCHGNQEVRSLGDSKGRESCPGDLSRDNETGSKENDVFSEGSSDGEKFDPDCSECRIQRRDPTPQEQTMYLHALSYKGPDWEYCTPVPNWAAEDWEESY